MNIAGSNYDRGIFDLKIFKKNTPYPPTTINHTKSAMGTQVKIHNQKKDAAPHPLGDWAK